MNFADIQNTWRSPHNRPTEAELEERKMKLTDEIRRRHRGSLLLLALVFAALAFFTGRIAWHLLWPDPALDPIDLAKEWGVLPFFALPWIAWVILLQLHRRHRARHSDYGRSIRTSVLALLDENRMERIRYRVVGALLVASVFVLPLIVSQLREVGKAGDEILIPAFVIYPAYVVGVLVWAAVFRRRQLLRRKQELEALLASYEQPA